MTVSFFWETGQLGLFLYAHFHPFGREAIAATIQCLDQSVRLFGAVTSRFKIGSKHGS